MIDSSTSILDDQRLEALFHQVAAPHEKIFSTSPFKKVMMIVLTTSAISEPEHAEPVRSFLLMRRMCSTNRDRCEWPNCFSIR